MADASGHRIVMLGAPGSGKGTQAALLAERVGIPAISTGEMLRAAVAAGSELGQRVESVMASGALVGDELMAELVRNRLAADDAAEGYILDGYPRTTPQADALDDILAEQDGALDHVIYLDVPEEELMTRAVARQRDDDREEVVRERLRVYRDQTEPLVRRFRDQGILRPVDGHRTVEQVLDDLLAIVQ